MQTKEEFGAAFNEAYASLNAAQKKSVDTIDGPVMVIAGPGTGKTQILTLRIANILLKTDTAPESILALTFTDAGAKNMRDRLRQFVGSDAYRVSIHTFHSFAGELISRYPDAYPHIIGGSVMNDLNKIDLLTDILLATDLKLLRPIGNPEYYLKPLLSTISELKREYVTPDDLATIIATQETELANTEKIHQTGAHKGKVRGEYTKREKNIAKNQELLLVYRQYEAFKVERKFYDFDDMIGQTVEALKNNQDLLYDLQERYQYVLADEHQDVNGSQNKILESLSSFHTRPNIFVVGDEKQAIYRFQGASLENFLYFEDRFPDTVTISLTDNYRSGQTILDVAHSLVAVEEGPLRELRVPLTAAAVDASTVSVATYAHEAVEHGALVNSICNERDAGTALSEIAVIVRTNNEVEELTSRLRGAGLKVNPSADSDILRHSITAHIESLIAVIAEPTNELALFTVLHGSYWNIEASELIQILSNKSYDRPLATVMATEPKLAACNQILAEARSRSLTDSPQRVLAFVLEASGFLSSVMSTDPIESPRIIRRLYDEIEVLVNQGTVTTLYDVARLFNQYRTHHVSLSAPFIDSDTEAVQVMTAHKSKGLEFEVVYIPHLSDTSWGKKSRRNHFVVPYTRHQHEEYDELDDERRLFYVAMTRAKRTLQLSYASQNSAGKELVESRLLGELDSEEIKVMDTTSAASDFSPLSGLNSDTQLKLDTGVLGSVLQKRGFSATSINNYLKSPWDWLYRNVLRIPEVPPLHMLYGTAMHGVLEQVSVVHRTEARLVTDSEIKQYLEAELARLPISTEEFTQLHQKGLETLAVYVPQLGAVLPTVTEEEKKIRVILPTGIPELPELPLTGMFDRLDFTESGKLLQVVDYKTGKPKTRNVIEGKTASSDGSYKRQLVFYALLLSLYDDDRYQTRDFVLSFVEPDSKGVIHEEAFRVTDSEIAELKEIIITVTKEILAGRWLTEPVEPNSTDYEDLASSMQALLL